MKEWKWENLRARALHQHFDDFFVARAKQIFLSLRKTYTIYFNFLSLPLFPDQIEKFHWPLRAESTSKKSGPQENMLCVILASVWSRRSIPNTQVPWSSIHDPWINSKYWSIRDKTEIVQTARYSEDRFIFSFTQQIDKSPKKCSIFFIVCAIPFRVLSVRVRVRVCMCVYKYV